MATKRAGWAFAAGLGALFLFVGATVFAFVAAVANMPQDQSFIPSETTDTGRAIGIAAWVLVPPGLMVAGALTTRALGVGWLGAFVTSIGALVASLLLVLALGPGFGTVLAALVAAPALVALGASLLTNEEGATLVVALAAVALGITVYATYPASTIAGFAAALAGWIVPPTVAGLFRLRGS